MRFALAIFVLLLISTFSFAYQDGNRSVAVVANSSFEVAATYLSILEDPKDYLKKVLEINKDSLLSWNTHSKNFHIEGFHSLIIARNPPGYPEHIARLYIFPDGMAKVSGGVDSTGLCSAKKILPLKLPSASGSVLIHNHQFDFVSITLKGVLENREYELIDDSNCQKISEFDRIDGIQYSYTSPILSGDGVRSLSKMRPIEFFLKSVQAVPTGHGYAFKKNLLHRIVIKSKPEETIILFIQGPRAENHPFISISEFDLPETENLANLYQPLSEQELDADLQFVRKNLEL